MITSNTDNINTNNNTAANGRIPTPTATTTTTTTATSPTAPPPSPKRHKRRLPTTFKFRNLLTYIRILILALALVSLILDAITISFQTNVMTLEYEDVARQAFLLLTPDLLAIGMVAFLFIYPSSLCCGSSSGSGSGSGSRVVEEEYVEEYYDYGDDDEDEERGEGGEGREGVGSGGAASSVTVTALTAAAAGHPMASSTTTATPAGAGKAMTRSQAQQQGAASSPSLSPATYNDGDDSLQQRRYNSQNTRASSHLQPPPSTSHGHQNLASSTNNNDRRYQQQLLHSQDHDRITTTSTFNTAATTLTPPSVRPLPAKGVASTVTGTIDGKQKQQQQDAQQQPTAAVTAGAFPGVSLAEMIAQEEMDETNRKRKRARLYTLARVSFSLGLTILALYWPAGQFKAPVGRQNTPPSIGEHQPIHGNNTLTYNPSPFPPPPPSSRMSPTFTSVFTPTPTSTSTIISGPTPAAMFNDGKETNLTRAATNASTIGYYIGSRHNRGRPKESPWCSEEESYGDDESAAVYCRSKVIRPVVTYVWSVFLIVELCIAAMAGDFSKHGIRRRRQSFGDEGMEEYYRHPRENQYHQEEIVVVSGDAEKQSERVTDERHGQSVQSLAISDGAGTAAGTGAGAHQQHHHRRPGSRTVH